MQFGSVRLRYIIKDYQGRVLCEDGFRFPNEIEKADICMYQSVEKAMGCAYVRKLSIDNVRAVQVIESVIEVAK